MLTPERFKFLYGCTDWAYKRSDHLREALTAFVESEAMREKAEHSLRHGMGQGVHLDFHCEGCDADWIKVAWEKWLGRQP